MALAALTPRRAWSKLSGRWSKSWSSRRVERTPVDREETMVTGDVLELLRRERAEFANYRRRTEAGREHAAALAAARLIGRLLPVVDDMARARAAASLTDEVGLAAIERKLRESLAAEGLEPINVVPGARFDPREHEAVVAVPGSAWPEGRIVEQFSSGYRLAGDVLRPARVSVAIGPSAHVIARRRGRLSYRAARPRRAQDT